MKKNIYITAISKILEILNKSIKNLDEETINKFLSDELELKIYFEEKSKKSLSKRLRKTQVDDEKMKIIIDKLNTIDSREKGLEYLSEASLKKVELEKILKILDIPFLKKDNIKVLTEKIIEATIGFRLRSKAIQGLNE